MESIFLRSGTAGMHATIPLRAFGTHPTLEISTSWSDVSAPGCLPCGDGKCP